MGERRISRRKLFSDAGKLVIGAALGAGLVGVGSGALVRGQEEVPEWPWPYAELDPKAVAERAYEAFYEGHCCYGAFEGIIGELRERVGYPYNLIPTRMMEYGKGGAVGWGTLCGALNGAAAAITLISRDYKQVVDELLGWYTITELPTYKPASPKKEIPDVTVVPGSPLCHVSVTRWCNASGFGSKSPERKERCARLTAQVAAHAAELLNKVMECPEGFTPTWTPPDSVGECLACHGPGKAVDNVFGKMDCLMCHERHM